ncbi:hypothetical protein NEIRO03_1045, partial [Nematocida sp. AWRm78]
YIQQKNGYFKKINDLIMLVKHKLTITDALYLDKEKVEMISVSTRYLACQMLNLLYYFILFDDSEVFVNKYFIAKNIDENYEEFNRALARYAHYVWKSSLYMESYLNISKEDRDTYDIEYLYRMLKKLSISNTNDIKRITPNDVYLEDIVNTGSRFIYHKTMTFILICVQAVLSFLPISN